jgi:uncharacterized repeat protein (TIGR01451 family)
VRSSHLFVFVLLNLVFPLPAQTVAAPSGEATIRAEGRGAPYLFLRDGRKVATNYVNGAPGAGARAVSLASADFDEDGMPDLASGYAASDGSGIVTLHRGNVAALWPYGSAIKNGEPPAFLPDAHVFTLPEAPDFLGTGDFDADGHNDLVAAHLGSRSLYFLRGDGHGRFSAPEAIALPGAVTAFATGEINRVDGLTDIVLGVMGTNGAQVLVFESPRGALRGKPEVISMPSPVTALAILPLDDDPWNDLAVAAGNDLLQIHGRDRKLSFPRDVREGVPAAEITRQTLPFAVRALTAGRFTSAWLLDLAALGDDGKMHFFERPDADYQAALRELPRSLPAQNGKPGPVHRGRRDAQSSPQKPQTKELVARGEVALPASVDASARLVTTHTSLTGRDDVIVTDGSAHALHVVSRQSRNTSSMHLAASLDVAAGAPAAVLAMRLTPSARHGLVILQSGQMEPSVSAQQAGNTFVVTNTMDSGASGGSLENTSIAGSLRTAISNATNAAGPSTITFAIPSNDSGYNSSTGTFTIEPIPNTNCGGSTGVTCDGLPPLPLGATLDGYSQSGATANSSASGDNAILKIVISGAAAGQGPVGLWLTNGDNLIRGMIVTGFNSTSVGTIGGQGIAIESGGNYIEGNFIGVDSTGTTAEPNYGGVVSIYGPNVVGGTVAPARNLLSGNNYANFATADQPPPNSDLFQGNYVGTDRTGTQKVGGGGIAQAGQALVLGGAATGAANLISGNIYAGITENQGVGNNFTPDGNLVQGNLIGTDLTGTVSIANAGGMAVHSGTGNLIGGTTPAARNMISGNDAEAMLISGIVSQTTVQGNYIGVDISGAHALANSGSGVDQSDTNPNATLVTSTMIGGEGAGAGNVISNGTAFGIELGGTAGGYALGNLIGTDATGTKAMGNGLAGVAILQGGSSYVIGGADSTAGNIIAYNAGAGVLINPAANNPGASGILGANSVVGNQIFSNQGAGVYVVSGIENLVSQNSIYSNADMGLSVNGQTEYAISSCQSNTNGANNLQNPPQLTAASGGTRVFVSATATDPNNNTSEFSNCVPMPLNGNTLNIAGSMNGIENTTYSIEFFQNTSCDASGYGQGQTFLSRMSAPIPSTGCVYNFSNPINISTADLSLQLTYNSSTSYPYLNPGGTFTYEAIVTNNGAASASAVQLTDTLPSGVTLASATPNQGSCNHNGATVTCNIGTLASGATTTVNIAVTVTGVGTITNSASVSSNTTDPNPSNNTASEGISSSYAQPVFDYFSQPSAVAGVGALNLTLYGAGFYQGVTTLTVNGSTQSYTLLNNQTCGTTGSTYTCEGIQVALSAALTATPGTITFVLTNPTPGGGTISPAPAFIIYPSGGAVTQFQLSGVPNPAQAGPPYNLTVTALDNCGNVVTGYRGVVSIGDGLGISTLYQLSGYQFTASDNGVHTFSFSFDSSSSGYIDTITVADEGTPSINGFWNVLVNPQLGAPNQLLPSSAPGSVPIGFPFQPMVVNVQDTNGNSLPGVAVTFTAPTAGASGTFSNNQTSLKVTSDVNGNAQAVLTANGTAGTFAVNVTATGISAQFMLTSTSNVPVHLTIVAPGGLGCASSTGTVKTPINTQSVNPLCVQVTDASSNPVNNVPVTFTAPTTGASINLANTSVLSGNEGASSYPGVAALAPIGVANATAGSYTVVVKVGTLSTSFNFTNTSPANAVGQIFNTGGNQSAPLRTQFPTPLVAIPQDANGDCLAQVPVTFSAPTSGPSATLSATTVTSDAVTCTVQVTATANSIAGGPYNVTASAGGVSVTFALTNTPGVITLTATGGTPQATLPGTQFAAPLKLSLVDANANPLACRINFFPPTMGATATLSADSVVANNAGAAQVTATSNSTVGSYNVTAQFGSAIAIFALANVTPGAIAATGGTPQSAAPGAQFAQALQATVTDQNGNPIDGITVTFSEPSSGAMATLSSTTAVTNALGVANVTATANNIAGSYSVYAKVGTQTADFSLTNSAFSPCDPTQAGKFTVLDVQRLIDEALGLLSPQNDLNGDGKVNVVDVEIVIEAVLTGDCVQ